MRGAGWLLLALAAALGLIGLALVSGALDWFGKLPGDIRIDRPRLSVRVPLVSMLLVSAGLSLLVYLLRRLL
jgi:hypothetical protein